MNHNNFIRRFKIVPEVGDLIKNNSQSPNFVNLVVKVEAVPDNDDYRIHSVRYATIHTARINPETDEIFVWSYNLEEGAPELCYDGHRTEYLNGHRVRTFLWRKKNGWSGWEIVREIQEIPIAVNNKAIIDNLVGLYEANPESYYYKAPEDGDVNNED
jgi:hypothetical protein